MLLEIKEITVGSCELVQVRIKDKTKAEENSKRIRNLRTAATKTCDMSLLSMNKIFPRISSKMNMKRKFKQMRIFQVI